MKENFLESVFKSAKSLYNTLPLILGTILFVSLILVIIPNSFYVNVFRNSFLDPLIGSLIGSISAGNPITSYIIGGELLEQGISLVAVTAFIVAWVTVGIIQLPAEAMILGRKFAILRNLNAFIFSVIVAILTVLFLGVLA